ncbi:MAG: SDR family oxidoreductase [Gammaproteobacteria bacterium]|nr:MAG: SDR family oxidoreductase [Gammaproteobacteria bacterium]
MSGRLQGRAVIVVGAGTRTGGTGNGKACAISYARAGASVVCVDNDEQAAQATAEEILREGGRALPLCADVNDESACRTIVETCLSAFAAVDVLHNNVGVAVGHDLLSMSRKEWDWELGVNVGGMFMMCREAIAHMKNVGKGAIINVSSVAASRPLPDIAYVASKGAVNSLTLCLASRYGRYNIRSNALLLGYIDTPAVRPAWKNERVRQINLRQVPMRRFASPYEVATAAVFLASDDASYINGAILPVDGGLCVSNT